MSRATRLSLGAALLLGLGVVLALASLAPSPLPPRPFILFRTLAPSAAHGRVAATPLGADARVVMPLACARLHFADGAGVCFTEEADGRAVQHAAYAFDRRFDRGRRLVLSGIPVRARVAPGGRHAGITVYAEEESPAGERLATSSVVVELPSAQVIGDLREFALDAQGHAVAPPHDFASIAFIDADRFYATLAAGGQEYLVDGSIGARRLRVVRPGIRNEAVSPDGARLIAKSRVGPRDQWQVSIIDLATWSATPLNHARSIDDQVDWLDAAHVIYHDVLDGTTGIYALPIDGGAPRLLIAGGFSPVVVR